jgi:uncharacterized protein with gpF-like domain
VQRLVDARLAQSMPFVTETIRQRILETVLAGLHAGDTSEAIRNRLTEMTGLFAPNEAATIAEETGTVMNEATVIAYRQTGMIDEKRWLTSRDQFVRPAGRVGAFNHVAAEGQIVPIDQPFIVSGQKMMYPRDWTLGATAGNISRCRCTSAPVPRRVL